MSDQNPTTEDELQDLRNYLKGAYHSALRSNGDNFSDAPATAFSDYAINRVYKLLHDQKKTLTAHTDAKVKEAEKNMLQWVEDMGKEATKHDSVHNMDEYNRHYGEAVSFPVHNKLVDEYLTPPTQSEEQ